MKRTRAAAAIVIECPTCQSHERVYHLNWSALACEKCNAMNQKENWLIKKGRIPLKPGIAIDLRGPSVLTWMLGFGCVFWATVAFLVWYTGR